jgi:hypothetical protein
MADHRAQRTAWLSSIILLFGGSVADAATNPPRQHVTAANEHHRGWMAADANAKHVWMYIASIPDNQVAVYDLDKVGIPQIGTIKDGISTPFGIVVDAQGNVYVANQNAGTVTVYAPGTTSPSLTISGGLQSPVGLAVDTNGDVYVGNQGSAPSVQVYAQGQTSPYRTITGPLIVHPGPLTFDDARNFFLVDNSTGVAEIPFGSQNLQSLGLQGITYPSGVAVAPITGNIYVSDLTQGKTFVYAPGGVTPIQTLKKASADFFTVANLHSNTYLFGPCTPCSKVNVFKFGGKKPWAVFDTIAGPQGIAVKPAGVP